MVEKRRYHFNVGEVKSEIIELILRHKGLIKEPFIRKNLQEKYDGIDQGTVNRHLHDLHNLGCLDFIPPSKKTTRANRWNITTLKQLESTRQHFPDVELNRYEKSLDIVTRHHLHYINPARDVIFRVQLLLSTSLFNLCIKNDTKTLFNKASEIYRFGKGFEDEMLIQSHIDDIYAKLINTIFKNINFLLSIWNKHIHNSLKTNIQSDPSDYLQTFSLSRELFQKMLNDIEPQAEEVKKEVIGRKLVKLLSLRISHETFRTSFQEIADEKNFKIMALKLASDITDDIFNKMVEEDSQGLYHKMVEINNHQRKIQYNSPFILFDHCFEDDILNDTVSDEEKEFIKRKKSSVQKDNEGIMSYDEWYIRSKLDTSGDGNQMSECTAYDNLYDEYLMKYMIPCLELPKV
jgi:hypothetical protein